MFKKILIANRGEIAVRIIKTCRKMGIKTVLVYSDADAGSLACEMADETIHIGPSPAAQSYLIQDKIVDAVRQSGVKRYMVVGGAGSLEIAPGKRLIDQPEFPEAYKPEAAGGVIFLGQLKTAADLEWTFLSPSAMFVPGEWTGKFRLGKDTLLSNENGSSISFEDYAIAFADELENPAHIRQRFTVGY